MADKGRFIVFEGIDGSGKTTQLSLLSRTLSERSILHSTTREQTDGAVGELITDVLTCKSRLDARALAALFLADRIDHLTKPDGMLETLAKGSAVLCDRYYLSSLAYQGVNLPMEWIAQLNRPCTELLRPDAVVFLDSTPQAAFDRLQSDRRELELFEKLSYLTKVRERYFEAFERFGKDENIIVIDADRDAQTVQADVWQAVEPLFR